METVLTLNSDARHKTASTLKPVFSLNDDDLVHNICVFLFSLSLQRNVIMIIIIVGDLFLWQIHQEELQYSHPGMVITVAREVASLKQISPEEVLAACYENTINICMACVPRLIYIVSSVYMFGCLSSATFALL